MADIISLQELADAKLDAQTLEDAVNGEPGKLIKSRTGREFYSLASVPQINTMTREEIDTAVASRAPQATTYTKTEVDSALSLKAPQATTYTKTEVDSALSLKAPQSTTYTKAEVDTTFAAYVGGRKAYTTLALAQAAQSSLPANTVVDVTNDPDPTKNGTYQWNSTTLTKSAYDPLAQAKSYSESQRKLGENNVTQMWFINPYYEHSGSVLYVKPGLYSTTDNCFYVRDKRYPLDTITRTKFWADLEAQVTPARFKVTSPSGVTDCIGLANTEALLYDHINKKIVFGSRDAVGDYTCLVANNNTEIGACLEEEKIRDQVLARQLRSEMPVVSEQRQVSSTYKIKGIAHRGYSTEAPENTLPAYVLAKQNGFKYVECDISFTSDDVAMLLHDDTIDRTSTGTGALADMTAAVAKTFDYGVWKNASYAGTQIPTLVEFLKLCRNLELHPYLEIKVNASTTKARVESVVDTVNSLGMQGKVTYISFGITELRTILAKDPTARLGLVGGGGESSSNLAATLKTASNEVFVDADKVVATEVAVNYARSKGLGFEIWTVYDLLTARGFADLGVNGMTLEGFNLQDALLLSYQE